MLSQKADHIAYTTRIDRAAARLSLAYILVAFSAFGIAALFGMLQGMVRGGLFELPGWLNYYQILTAHGVLMGLVFTTYFIIGFFFSGIARTTGGSLHGTALRLGWIGFVTMVIGTVMDVVTILSGDASVLYTFYAPMKASPYFYIGTALLVVGSWLAGYGMFASYAKWRREHKGERSPLFVYLAVATMILWQVCTIPVAVEVLFQLIPWSFGWTPTINVLLSRTLFWFFGHPLVYFWLMPAYAAWYVCIPRIIGGKIFSDTLSRVAFILFLLFSIPVGFHHQLMEPGISPAWKMVHVVLTLAVVLPSLMTAFSMFAVFETTGRAKGGKGLYGWFKHLPWTDVRFFAPFVGMLFFIPAGTGGIINTSNQMNAVVHNTIWVTGHFHITVGAAVAMTFFGVAYWLVPALTGRKLTATANRMGMVQTVFWTVGMGIMSLAMHTMGLQGVPRRTAYTTYMDNPEALNWIPWQRVMGMGGGLLFVSAILLIAILIYLAFFAPKGYTEYPIGETDGEQAAPALLERWTVWLSVLAVLCVLAYAYPIMEQIQHAPPGSPGIRTW
ncbi:b(o/a)3-type cytochrome-c oxidase subunit 1 [Brevibacillus sp. SYP-B805]|uniref:b(o/a)3-type cytochrome-c oxidase subunit 1 n=1 Tax=Brevibacillus sp. SYP-B805 TaxID=1578199 RepID=UPI0013EABCAC|nr:b(o/a)3-type cytochrome-c oxidase subunit 1 [Brevibacillus sp. SYP-B805]NGQ94192.1 b(o/a)3-type cytochrome-c oxidase subunit 1 [Brevibacillus sp. SYP-B805]